MCSGLFGLGPGNRCRDIALSLVHLWLDNCRVGSFDGFFCRAFGGHHRGFCGFFRLNPGHGFGDGVFLTTAHGGAALIGCGLGFGFPGLFLGLQPFEPGIESLLGLLGQLFLFVITLNGRLGNSVILHQRNIRWTNITTATTFDAVSEVVGAGLVIFFGFTVPVELLGQ